MLDLDNVLSQMKNKGEQLIDLASQLSKKGTERLNEHERRLVREVIADRWDEEFEWQLLRFKRTGEPIELPKPDFRV